jgi:hypothetical protein
MTHMSSIKTYKGRQKWGEWGNYWQAGDKSNKYHLTFPWCDTQCTIGHNPQCGGIQCDFAPTAPTTNVTTTELTWGSGPFLTTFSFGPFNVNILSTVQNSPRMHENCVPNLGGWHVPLQHSFQQDISHTFHSHQMPRYPSSSFPP